MRPYQAPSEGLFVFVCAFAAQYLIGEIINLYPETADGTYDPQAYQTGFGVFLAVQLIALAWYLRGVRSLRQKGIVKN